MSKHIKVRVDSIELDSRYQRELDQPRALAMSKHIDMDRVGVPVVSKRANGKLVVIDGQHRVSALQQAGMGSSVILCEVHEGLNLVAEAALFLKLNGGRKAVGAYDKWRAELIAKVPVALEIDSIITSAGLRISKGKGVNCVCAINAIRYVHNSKKNLSDVLLVLKAWSDGDPGVYDGDLIKAVAAFLSRYPEVDLKLLVTKLAAYSPERIQNRIKRNTNRSDGVPFSQAACISLREIYNWRSKAKLPPLHRAEAA